MQQVRNILHLTQGVRNKLSEAIVLLQSIELCIVYMSRSQGKSNNHTERRRKRPVKTNKFYDRLGRGQVRAPVNPTALRKLHNRIKARLLRECLPKHRVHTALDLACGRGGDLWKYREHVATASLVCLDASPDSLLEARGRWVGREQHPFRREDLSVEFHWCDLTSVTWPIDDRLFDNVAAMFCLGYILSDEGATAAFFDHVCRLLAPGAKFCAIVVDDNALVQLTGANWCTGTSLDV